MTNKISGMIKSVIKSHSQIIPYIEFASSHWEDLISRDFGKFRNRRQIYEIYEEYLKYCSQLGLSNKGLQHPDWRVYSVLDFASLSCQKRCTRKFWFPDNPDLMNAFTKFEESEKLIKKNDPVSTMANIRSVIEEDLSLSNRISALLTGKYFLIGRLQEDHDLFLPVYQNLCTQVLKDPSVWTSVTDGGNLWPVLSTIHLFPYQIGTLDVMTFSGIGEWFIVNYLLLEEKLLKR